MDGDPDVRVLGAVVSFHPEARSLAALLRVLGEQCDGVLVIDNTPGPDDALWEMVAPLLSGNPGLRVCRAGRNIGLGAAFNLAAEVASQEGYSHLLLSDQDSLPRAGMVRGLLDAERAARARGAEPAAVGPLCLDNSSGRTLSFQCHRTGQFFYRRRLPESGCPDLEVVSLISSGSLLPLGAWERVGPFREDFLVDNVDMEWCLRARAAGFVVIATDRSVLEHRLGGEPLAFWLFGPRREPGYGPLRLYFRFRNFAFMVRWLSHVPAWWSASAAPYWLKVAILHVLFSPRRRDCAVAVFLGLRDGLRAEMRRGAANCTPTVAQGRRMMHNDRSPPAAMEKP